MERSNVADEPRILARRIEEEIALGLLRPRERLTEDDLMRQHGVKRHIARQTLAVLEGVGVVSRERNKGAAVRDFSPREVEQIYDVRELLLGHAAELIPLPAPSELTAQLKDIYARHSSAAATGDRRSVFRENLKFHAVLEAACGNPHLYEALEHFGYRAHAIRSHTILSPDLLATAIDQHHQIIEALETGDRNSLRQLMVAHIQPAKHAYLQFATQLPIPAQGERLGRHGSDNRQM